MQGFSRRKLATVFVSTSILLTTCGPTNAWADPISTYASNGATCSIVGTASDDTISGTSGNDVICGLEGNDTIYGLEGDDFLDGGAGDDTLSGGLGNDTIDPGSGNDNLSGDLGINTVYYASVTTDIAVDLIANTTSGINYQDVLSDIQNVVTGSGNDSISGNSSNNLLNAGAGNDRILAGLGNDTLLGGLGNDVINGGPGSDIADFSDNSTVVEANLYTGKATGAGKDSLIAIEKLAGVTENSQPGTRSWMLNSKTRKAKNSSPNLEGYTTSPSAIPGVKIDLRVSSTKSFYISAYRLGYYNGDGARLIWKSPLEQARNTDKKTYYETATRTTIPEWESPILIDTANWLPGFYLLKLSSSDNSLYERYVPYVVRSESTKGKVVIQASTLTTQAYNSWGGRSLYKGNKGFGSRAYAVTLARPNAEGAGAGRLLLSYEFPIVELAEELGIPLAYVTDYDISVDKGILNGANAFISLGHDEYWTKSKYDEVLRARDSGTNLVFFGANAMYWRTRLTPQGNGKPTLMTVYKSASLDPVKNSENTTTRWRESPKANSESKLLGQQYVCFPADATVTITNPNFFAFAKTGVKKGSTFPHLAKVEVDGIAAGRQLPKGVKAYTRADISCGKASYVSAITMYIGPKNSGVIDIASMGWITYGFRHPKLSKFVKQVSENILVGVSKGPLGKVLKPSER